MRRFIVHKLARGLVVKRSGAPDVAAACVISIGRVPLAWSRDVMGDEVAGPASASRQGQIRRLLRLLDDKREPRVVRAHVPTALAALLPAADEPEERWAVALRTAVGDALLERFTERRREPVEVLQSCAIAFGTLGVGASAAQRERMIDALSDFGGKRSVRRFALLSLGRIGGASPESAPGDPRAAPAHAGEREGGPRSLGRARARVDGARPPGDRGARLEGRR